MNLPFLIAKKYFFSKKKKSFINLISILAMLGVGIGTMALVIVLSVFNGLEDLNRQIFKSFDADIQVTPKKGKSFEIEADKLLKIKQLTGIDYVMEVIEDNALAKYENAQMVVNLKGVDENFVPKSKLRHSLVEGKFSLEKDSTLFALVGGNVFSALNISLQNIIVPLQLWYPINQKTLSLNPEANVNETAINISGVYSLENTHDDFVFVPLQVAANLTDLGNERTALEIFIKEGSNLKKIQNQIQEIYGTNFNVLNSDEQNASLFKAIKIEKLFIFVALVFIIFIAAVNIFSSLTMLAIDKKKDIKTLQSMGSTKSLISRIFLSEGAIISFSGAFIGLVLGFLICWVQQRFGLIKMGMQTAIIDAYPVKMQLSDFLLTALAIICITFIVSIFPAKKATEF